MRKKSLTPDQKNNDDIRRITVTVRGQNDTVVRKAFEGRWLIGEANSGERFEFDGDEGVSVAPGFEGYSIAITKGNRIVVLEHMQGDEPTFKLFDDCDAFTSANIDNGRYPQFPDSLHLAVDSALDIERIEEMDI